MLVNRGGTMSEHHGTILAVDDTSEALALLAAILESNGYKVRPSDSGELALLAIEENRPDLILLDLRMKGLSGLDVCRRLKGSQNTKDIPIILISAFADTAEWVEGLKIGAADYITKPFQSAELLLRVETQLALSNARASIADQAASLLASKQELRSEIVRRQDAEDSIRIAHERLRLATDAGKMGIWDWDIALNRLIWDDRMYELYGVKREDFFGAYEAWLKGVHPDDIERCNLESLAARKGEKMYDTEFRIVHPDGSVRNIKALGTVLMDALKIPTRMIGLNYDITELKQAQQQNEMLKRSIDVLAESAYWFGADGRFLYVNDSACETLGYTREELLKMRVVDVNPLATFEMMKTILDALRTKGSMVAESVHRRKDGTEFPVEIRTSYVQFDGNEYFCDFAVDITNRRRTEEAIATTQRLESLGVLAGGIAHDFNNLLSGIYGFIDLASQRTVDAESIVHLNNAMGTIERARGLTHQLLTFAKGGAPIKKIAAIGPLIQDAAGFALSGSKMSCVFEIQERLWMCEFDQEQLGQVIDNIVINARQAAPDGGVIRIKARNVFIGEKMHSTLPLGNYVKVSFIDEGEGIPKEILPRIFDPFFTTKSTGHGLGLSTCYSIVNRHSGCIDVESELGRGTAFHVYLPASPGVVMTKNDVAPTVHRGEGTILLMDDEIVVRETIERMLRRFGYSVICTQNGPEAMQAFRSEQSINGIILDLTIPGSRGGIEVVRQIRETDQEIPVFVVSGYADDPVMASPEEYGFTASLSKPFMRVDLAELLERYLAPQL
jgi:PAS domain S-box-containing protein